MVDVRSQEPPPADSAAIEQLALPSLTVTAPEGTAPPPATVTLTAYAPPITDGSGVSETIDTVGAALFTVCAVVPLELP